MNEHLSDALTEEAKQHKTFDATSGEALLSAEQLVIADKEPAQHLIPAA